MYDSGVETIMESQEFTQAFEDEVMEAILGQTHGQDDVVEEPPSQVEAEA